MVVIVAVSHLFPFRTEKLSPPTPMVLQRNVGEQETVRYGHNINYTTEA